MAHKKFCLTRKAGGARYSGEYSPQFFVIQYSQGDRIEIPGAELVKYCRAFFIDGGLGKMQFVRDFRVGLLLQYVS